MSWTCSGCPWSKHGDSMKGYSTTCHVMVTFILWFRPFGVSSIHLASLPPSLSFYLRLLVSSLLAFYIPLHITFTHKHNIVYTVRPFNPPYRMYGALTGMSKLMVGQKHGQKQLKLWRRSYATRPPQVSSFSSDYPGNDDRCAWILL